MERISLDAYVIDALMPDLVGHDHRPSAFLVYLFLFRKTQCGTRSACVSHAMIADSTGLSKSSVQAAVDTLKRRALVSTKKKTPTSAPVYTLKCHWRSRRA
jgi:hypothetical protein